MDIIQVITGELKTERWQIEAAVKLLDEGNTIPFISRYRKEMTGSLNDEQLRMLYERLSYLRNLQDKKKQVLSSILLLIDFITSSETSGECICESCSTNAWMLSVS